MPPTFSYRDAGVDIDNADQLIHRIGGLAKATARPEVIAGIGGFGSLFAMPKGYTHPVLVSGTDGVGTKLKLASRWDGHDTIGIDLVAMSVNDILVQGAEPLFFLDYFSCGRLEVDTTVRVIAGIAEGCRQAGCALVGGETAEMPGMYPDGEYDLAGFVVGAVERDAIINGQQITAGDVVLGLGASGLHANGFSLVRKVMDNVALPQQLDGVDARERLLTPTRIYVATILNLLKQVAVKGLAHITGGGITENLPRVLPQQCGARIDTLALPQTELMTWLARSVEPEEMLRTFNGGIGMMIVVAPHDEETVQAALAALGEQIHRVGEIINRQDGSPRIRYV